MLERSGFAFVFWYQQALSETSDGVDAKVGL
jgi:hypothetical protein